MNTARASHHVVMVHFPGTPKLLRLMDELVQDPIDTAVYTPNRDWTNWGDPIYGAWSFSNIRWRHGRNGLLEPDSLCNERIHVRDVVFRLARFPFRGAAHDDGVALPGAATLSGHRRLRRDGEQPPREQEVGRRRLQLEDPGRGFPRAA